MIINYFKKFLFIFSIISIFFHNISYAEDEIFNYADDPCNTITQLISENNDLTKLVPQYNYFLFGLEISINENEDGDAESIFVSDINYNHSQSYIDLNNEIILSDFHDKDVNIKLGDIIHSINGEIVNLVNFENLRQRLIYSNTSHRLNHYIFYDAILDDIDTEIQNEISIGIYRPGDFSTDHKIDFNEDIFYVKVKSEDIFEPVRAEAYFNINQIHEINSKDSTFIGNYSYKIRIWDKSYIANVFGQKFLYEEIDYASCVWENDHPNYSIVKALWQPEIDWLNKLDNDLTKQTQSITITYWEDIVTNVCPCVIIDIEETGLTSFGTNFDYRSFPFDKQNLNVFLLNKSSSATHYNRYGIGNAEFNHFGEPSMGLIGGKDINVLDDVSKKNVSGWDIGKTNYIVKTKKIMDYSELRENISSGSYSSEDVNWDTRDQHTNLLQWQTPIERQWEYYLFKIIAPIIIILIVCWSVFWTRRNELESRLTVTITCFLALVAYTYVIDKDLPKLSYLTLMDYIILISYFFAAVPSIISIISHRFESENYDKSILIDKYSKILGPSLYLLSIYSLILLNVSEDNSLEFIKNIAFR